MSEIISILKQVTNSILSHKPVTDILQEVTELVCQRLDIDVCCIYTHQPKARKLALRASCGFDNQPSAKLGVSQGLTGMVFKSQEMINIIDPMKHPKFKLIPGLGEEQFLSYLGVPMTGTSGVSVGCLVIQTRKAELMHERVVDLASTLASQMAIMVSQEGVKEVLQDHSIEEEAKEANAIVDSLDSPEEESNADLLLEGAAVSPGVAYGPVRMLNSREIWDRISEALCEDRETETARLKEGLELAGQETIRIQERATKVFIEADASIFFAQLLLLEDSNFISDMNFGIDFYNYTAEFAVKHTVEKYIKKFQDAKIPQLRERALDLLDVGIRLVLQLQGLSLEQINNDSKVVLVAQEIMPSDLVRIPNENILAVVCSQGGVTSHTAILARSLQIPAVMSVNDIDELCDPSDSFLVNGDDGVIIINPSDEQLKIHEERLQPHRTDFSLPLLQEKSRTKDKTRIKIQGNICMVSDFNLMNKFHNDGVGLYRTEFMFMLHENFPSENEQYRVYRSIAKLSEPNKVTIRALDVGGDKPLSYFDHTNEADPMLGYRSIRILLEHPEIFAPHLRAMLRAAQRGNMQILFPMVAHVEDARAVYKFIHKQHRELVKIYGDKFIMPPLGAMIEMPSSVCQLREILKYMDFVSIGTNDLVQYYFAVDRGNKKVDQYFRPLHPIILRTLAKIIKTCNQLDKPVSLCGEISANPLATPLLIGMGLRRFSMPPMAMGKIKILIDQLKLSDCERITQRAMSCSTHDEVIKMLRKFFAKHQLPLDE